MEDKKIALIDLIYIEQLWEREGWYKPEKCAGVVEHCGTTPDNADSVIIYTFGLILSVRIREVV